MRRRMRTRWSLAPVLIATLTAAWTGVAGAYKPTVVKIGNEPPVRFNGGFSPTKLPKDKLAPVRFNVEGTIDAVDGGHPPPLQELVVEVDKNVAIDAKGLATCGLGKIFMGEGGILKACQAARIGRGELEFDVAFPETEPFRTTGRAFAFNGGVKNGVTSILVFAFIPTPVSAAVLMTIKVSKIHDGPYGARWRVTIPTIAGGSASLTKFDLELFRRFAYKGRKHSYLLAKCPTGRLRAHWEARFADSSNDAADQLVRPCTGRD